MILLNSQYGHLVCHHQKGGNCWPCPYEYKVLMKTNTNVICLSVLFKQASKCCLECCDYDWLILFKNRSSREEDSRIPNSPGISSYRVFAAASSFATRYPVDLTRILVCCRFYFLRFLLICHWESLNLTYTLKWFFFLDNISEYHIRTVLGTGCSRCSLSNLQQTFFNDFSHWFLGQLLLVF